MNHAVTPSTTSLAFASRLKPALPTLVHYV